MRSGSLKAHMGFPLNKCVNENPIWFDMAVATSRKIAAQRMVFVFQRQWLAFDQEIQNRFEFRQVVATLLSAFDIFLKLGCAAESPHSQAQISVKFLLAIETLYILSRFAFTQCLGR